MAAKNITFIGAGNMARSLVGGLLAKAYPAANISAADPKELHRAHFQTKFAIDTFADNQLACEEADIVVLAVKPQSLAEVCEEISPTIQQNKPLLMSIAAGVTLATLSKYLGDDIAIVRCMPNMPALVGSGATALLANRFVDQTQCELAESIMRSVGVAVWLDDEAQMDIVTALSGSGPAYYFLFMEALQQAAIDAGLEVSMAELLTEQTALGAAHLALEADIDLQTLRKQVMSPGGTTEAAINVMLDAGVTTILQNAFEAARKRSEALANEGEGKNGK